jgi:circadian clock protein KaiB
MARRRRRSPRGLETAGAGAAGERHALRLYVTGATARSLRAVTNVKDICERYLKGRYDLEVVDIYQQPALARQDQIVAVPTLVKRLPLPVRFLVGDLSMTEHVLQGLGVVPQAS